MEAHTHRVGSTNNASRTKIKDVERNKKILSRGQLRDAAQGGYGQLRLDGDVTLACVKYI